MSVILTLPDIILSLTDEEEDEDKDAAGSTLVDGNTYITYVSGISIIRVNKDDPSDKVRIPRPGIKNLIVEPELKRVFYTRGSAIYSEPLDFTESTGKEVDGFDIIQLMMFFGKTLPDSHKFILRVLTITLS